MNAKVSHWLGDVEDLYHETIDVGIHNGTISLGDYTYTPLQAELLAALLMRAARIARAGPPMTGAPADRCER